MTKKKKIFIFSRISILKQVHNLYSMNVILIRRSGKLIDKIVYYNCNYRFNVKKKCMFSDLFFNVVNDYLIGMKHALSLAYSACERFIENVIVIYRKM